MYSINSVFRNNEYVYYIDIPAESKDAPLLILSHGFPDNAFGWHSQIDKFKGQYHIVAVFMHGTLNNTRVNKKRIESKELILDMLAIIYKTDMSRKKDIYLIGHDLGCFLNNTLYHQLNGRVKGIVNINGLGLQQFYARKFKISQWLKSYYVFLTQLFLTRLLVSKVLPKTFLKLIYKLCKVQKDDPLYNNDERVFRGIYIYRILFKRIFSFLFKKKVKIDTPSLFIWGNRDNFLDIPNLKEVNNFYTKAQVRILPGGHWVHRSQEERTNRILEKSLMTWTKLANNRLGVVV